MTPRTLKLSVLTAVATTASAATLLWTPTAGATIAPSSNGVGVCFSQLAIDPSLVGADRFGDGITSLASPGTPGSEIPANLAGARNTCGEPPGPGHL